MGIFISSVIILASLLLIFVVYVQNPKGGGLSSDFGAAQQIGGVQKTNDFIDKATWSLAGLVAVLSIILTLQNSTVRPTAPDPEPDPTEQPAGDGTTNADQGATDGGTTEGGTQVP
ncbi:MAG: preprotein translocase subunit SecG [Crocinitomicaceae bacterium]|nr:preprotein translocase subunit SecG [Crocinitomicaceae bacterium]